MKSIPVNKLKRPLSQGFSSDVSVKTRRTKDQNPHSKKAKIQGTPATSAGTPLPAILRHASVVSGNPRWNGQESLENVVIIGDSYSKCIGCKTWVDHLEYYMQKRDQQIQVHNLALPGATAEDDLSSQLANFFTIFPKKNSPTAIPPLDTDRTTFFIFFGINDCGRTDSDDLEPIVEAVMDAAHDVYVQAGIRNFVFIDVPPIDHSPQAVDSEGSDVIKERVQAWNNILQNLVAEFSSNSKNATVFLFSSNDVLTEVLENPLEFDLCEDDTMTEGGSIWDDDLHLTAEVHDILAEKLLMTLLSGL